MERLSRRAVLRLFGVSGIGMSAGCASMTSGGNDGNSEFGDHEPGALVVRNMHSLPHVVYVSVTGPESLESVESKNITREIRSIIAGGGLEAQIPIGAGETKVYSDFLSGSIPYRITAWLGDPEEDETPLDSDDGAVIREFSPAAVSTPDAHGSFAVIQVLQTGVISGHVTHVHDN